MGVPISALTPTAAPPQPTRKISTARASFFRDQLRAGFFLAEVLGFSGTTMVFSESDRTALPSTRVCSSRISVSLALMEKTEVFPCWDCRIPAENSSILWMRCSLSGQSAFSMVAAIFPGRPGSSRRPGRGAPVWRSLAGGRYRPVSM